MNQPSPSKIRFVTFLPAIGWFILSFILLTLPGNQLPSDDWFDKVQIDKFVHIFLFGMLVYLAYLPWLKQPSPTFRSIALVIAFLAFDYGIAMEFVQKYLIPHRSFDVWDIVADGIGCCIPFFWVQRKSRSAA